jgi:plasmid stabilization system protein ParE
MDRLTFHDDAREEYVAGYIWYYERGSHIADAFEREVEYALSIIREAPGRWPNYGDNWRRVVLRRFPYAIVYGEYEGDIVIMAVMHTKRRPGYWKDRTSDR